jgi:predicted Zn finger-like uncharacterized protein
MIVACPYCATRFTLDEARLAGANPMLKCSRCRHVFPAPSPKKQAPASPKGAAAAQESLPLPFEESGWKDEAPSVAGDDLTISEPEERYTLGADGPADDLVLPAHPAAEPDATLRDERPSARRAAAASRPPAPAGAPVAAAGVGAAGDEDGAGGEGESDADDAAADTLVHDAAPQPASPRGASRRRSARGTRRREDESGKVWVLGVFLAVVLASYAMLTRALFASPNLCDHWLSRVPLLGSMGSEHLLSRKVALSEVAGSYQRLRDGKQVFIISGKAVNTAPVALHGVQIAGKLFDSEGHEVDQKVIYCGNVISAKMLKDLTPPGISILQSLRPTKGFTIEPGESSTFVIVFMDPPPQAVEFGTQVAAAQRHT